jgi:chromosome segregation ATPase
MAQSPVHSETAARHAAQDAEATIRKWFEIRDERDKLLHELGEAKAEIISLEARLESHSEYSNALRADCDRYRLAATEAALIINNLRAVIGEAAMRFLPFLKPPTTPSEAEDQKRLEDLAQRLAPDQPTTEGEQ